MPGAVVVSYVNTTAEVKALTDICCTSSNAVEVVASIPADKTVLFCPDQFLGAHVKRETGRDNIHIWAGECHVHAGINGDELTAQANSHPDADLFIHPECGCATSALYLAGEVLGVAELDWEGIEGDRQYSFLRAANGSRNRASGRADSSAR